MKILFLDDDKDRHRKFRERTIGCVVTFVFTYEEAIAALDAHVFDEAHLDHDLSEMAAAGFPAHGERSGTDVAEHIAGMSPANRPKRIVIHSLNVNGSRRMESILRRAAHPHVRRMPFRG